MRVHNNAQIAFTTHRANRNVSQIEKTLEKLGTGLKAGKGAQTASDISISEKMRAQIRGLSQAQRNMNDALSALEVMNEGMNNSSGLTDRMRELAVMAATDTMTDEDRGIAQEELNQLIQEIDDTAKHLEFNTRAILGETIPLVIQIGSNSNQKIEINLIEVTAKKLGLVKDGSSDLPDHVAEAKAGEQLLTREQADQFIRNVDYATTVIAKHLTEIGSKMHAIESHLANAAMYESNLTRALSELEDSDMSREMMNFVQTDIRQQGDQLLIKQVNSNLQELLRLFN